MNDATMHKSSADIVVNLTTNGYFTISSSIAITVMLKLAQRGIKLDKKTPPREATCIMAAHTGFEPVSQP